MAALDLVFLLEIGAVPIKLFVFEKFLSITSRWALMAARGWARLILDRRRDLLNDRPSRAAAAEAPLDGAAPPLRQPH